MGHHNAQLDPLGISCVNFDDAPVNTGFQDVGETPELKKQSASVCGVNVASPSHPSPLSLSLFLSGLLLNLSPALLLSSLSLILRELPL